MNSKIDLSKAVELSMDGIVISNLEGKIIDVNEATLKLCGFLKKDELVGKNIFNYIAPEEIEKARDDLENIITSGCHPDLENHIISRSGKKIPVSTNIDLMHNDNGKPIGFISIFRDITARKVMEEKLRESEEKYYTLFNFSPEGIALVGVDGTLLDCNGVVEKLIGKCKRELVGKPLDELNLFSEEDISKLIEIFPKALANRTLGPIDMAIRCGRERGWVEVYPAPLKNRGEVAALQLIVRDITERKQNEEEMKRRLMKFILDNGKVYLISEIFPTTSIEAFKDLLRIGYQGIVFSRTPEKDFRNMINNGHFDFYWLAENNNGNTIPPKVKDVERTIERFLITSTNKFAVLLSRIDYLIFKNGFKKTLEVIQRLRELAYITGNIIIITVDPSTLSDREQRYFEVECSEIKPRLDKKMLAEEQFKLLRYIYENNIIGVKPSYTDIGQDLGISKPTIRKRIRLLLNAGYIMEMVKGRNKFVELTQIGKNFFIK